VKEASWIHPGCSVVTLVHMPSYNNKKNSLNQKIKKGFFQKVEKAVFGLFAKKVSKPKT
jgi:hypothetical protein